MNRMKLTQRSMQACLIRVAISPGITIRIGSWTPSNITLDSSASASVVIVGRNRQLGKTTKVTNCFYWVYHFYVPLYTVADVCLCGCYANLRLFSQNWMIHIPRVCDTRIDSFSDQFPLVTTGVGLASRLSIDIVSSSYKMSLSRQQWSADLFVVNLVFKCGRAKF